MSNEDETKVTIALAQEPASWLKWAGYGIVMGLGLSYSIAPGAWIVYALCGYSFGLVYWGYACYDQFAKYYNSQQFKNLDMTNLFGPVMEHIKGTNEDNDGLTKEDKDEDETSTD